MSIVFRIATTADHGDNPTATIDVRQLAAFRALLRETEAKLGIDLLEPDEDGDDPFPYTFEARVCPLALASMARVFGYDADVIAVLEEAQFRGRRVSFWRQEGTAGIRMSVSITSDQGVELDLANGKRLRAPRQPGG